MGAICSLFHIIFFFVVLLLHVSVHAQGDVCANVNCVKGTCVPYNGSILGYDCDCYSGWKKLEIPLWNWNLTLPSCILPNCTLNFQCGNGATPLSPPPPSQPPPFNPFDPCNLVWCGEGSCIANGTGYYCQCNQGSSNLLSNTSLACVKQCSFGADCSGLGLGPHTIAPPPPTNGTFTLAAPPKSSSPPKGLGRISPSWKSCGGSNMILLSAIILALVL